MKTRHTVHLVLTLALAAGAAQAADVAEAKAGLDTPVSSSGQFTFVEAAGGSRFSAGFHGDLADGEAGDFAATVPNRELSAEEVWSEVMREAKTGNVGQEVVIGADNRTRVNPTTVYPSRAIGQITFSQRGGNFICTGWLIGPDTVATAGHCVHEGGTSSSSGWSTNVRFFAGRNGNSNPYGGCNGVELHTVNGWFANQNEAYDYGVVKLDCNVGNTVGYFGFYWQTATLVGKAATVRGYPGDKTFGTQWTHTKTVTANTANQVFYQVDTAGGQSGSPVYHNKSGCGAACGFAIHAYGTHGGSPHGNNNHGTRINQSVFNNLKNWKNE
jgi:glutamyl endopeptidase